MYLSMTEHVEEIKADISKYIMWRILKGSSFFLFMRFISIALARIIVEPKYWRILADSPKIIIPEINTNIVDITVVRDTQDMFADFKTFKTKNQFIGQMTPFATNIKISSVVISPSFGIQIREHKKETVIYIASTAISFVFLTENFLKTLNIEIIKA